MVCRYPGNRWFGIILDNRFVGFLDTGGKPNVVETQKTLNGI